MKVDVFPKKEGEFNTWAGNFMMSLRANAMKWNIAISHVTVGERRAIHTYAVYSVDDLDLLFLEYKNLFDIANNMSTRTTAAIAAKDTAKRLFVEALRNFLKEFIIYNSLVTDPDLILLGLTPHKTTHSRAKRAQTFPIPTKFENHAPGVLTIHAEDSEGKKLKRTNHLMCCYAVLEHPPQKMEELTKRVYSNTSVITLKFDMKELGKTVYFAFCWRNNRGEDGYWGNIQARMIS